MEKEIFYCQSCGMPMQATEDFGTEAGGKPSEDYCVYCYTEGVFMQKCSMEEMIQLCAQLHEQFRDESGKSYTREQAIASMREFFPMLKRWQ